MTTLGLNLLKLIITLNLSLPTLTIIVNLSLIVNSNMITTLNLNITLNPPSFSSPPHPHPHYHRYSLCPHVILTILIAPLSSDNMCNISSNTQHPPHEYYNPSLLHTSFSLECLISQNNFIYVSHMTIYSSH